MSFWRRLLRGSRGLPEPPPLLPEPFVPVNDVESALVAGGKALAAALPAARLFVPSPADVTTLPEGASFRPVVLDTDVGPCVVALTSADRLKALLPAVPDVQSGLEVEGAWVIAQCPDGVGLAIDPGWSAGLTIPASELAALRAGPHA